APTATNSNPQLGGTGVTEVDDAGGGTGVFAENVAGLSPGARYSFVAFATNRAATTYTSPASTFTAGGPPVPSPVVTSITEMSSTHGGGAPSDGRASPTRRSAELAPTATNSNPQLGGTGVTEVDDAGGGTGVFAESVTRLSPGTQYSFVAF